MICTKYRDSATKNVQNVVIVIWDDSNNVIWQWWSFEKFRWYYLSRLIDMMILLISQKKLFGFGITVNIRPTYVTLSTSYIDTYIYIWFTTELDFGNLHFFKTWLWFPMEIAEAVKSRFNGLWYIDVWKSCSQRKQCVCFDVFSLLKIICGITYIPCPIPMCMYNRLCIVWCRPEVFT